MARQLAAGCGLIFLLLLNDPASAQFAGGGQAGAGQVGAALPAPVRKTIEDDGISAYTITDLGTLPDSAAASVATAATPRPGYTGSLSLWAASTLAAMSR